MWGAALLLATLGACGFPHGRLPQGDQPIDAAEDGVMPPSDSTIDAAIDPPPLCSEPMLRACFTFDGNTQDGSSSNNDITASVTPTFVAGRTGDALLTTSGTYTTGATTSLNVSALTIKMWIKPDALPGTTRMGLLDSSNRYRVFVAAGGAVRCALTNGADLTSATGVLTTGVWQRVTCTVGGGQMRIYVNGNMVANTTAGAIPTASNGMVVGHNNPSGENFNGALDDLQVFAAVVAP